VKSIARGYSTPCDRRASERRRVPATMAAFPFSDDSAYVNGQTILLDGGANLD
jgi:hypothetical protein